MKTKKMMALLLAALCLCAIFAGCAAKNQSSDSANTPAANVTDFTTIGEAMAVAEENSVQTASYADYYVYVFELNGTYWRLTAQLTPEQSTAIMALDILEEDYNDKLAELVSPLAITNCENLNEMMLTEEEMNALAGKTGEDLLNAGWTSGYGYNLEDMEFYLEYAPFCYTVVFESDQALENTDDFDVLEAIKPLTVKSVAFNMIGDSATDLPAAGE